MWESHIWNLTWLAIWRLHTGRNAPLNLNSCLCGSLFHRASCSAAQCKVILMRYYNMYSQCTCRVSHFICQLIALGQNIILLAIVLLPFITITKENQLVQYYADEILDRKELRKANCCHKLILLTLDLMALWWKNLDLFIQVLEPAILHWINCIDINKVNWLLG